MLYLRLKMDVIIKFGFQVVQSVYNTEVEETGGSVPYASNVTILASFKTRSDTGYDLI